MSKYRLFGALLVITAFVIGVLKHGRGESVSTEVRGEVGAIKKSISEGPETKSNSRDETPPMWSQAWARSEAGKDFFASLNLEGFRQGYEVIEDVERGRLDEIVAGLISVGKIPGDDRTGYRAGDEILVWRDAEAGLHQVVAFGLGVKKGTGSDPRLVYDCGEYFLFCHERYPEFEMGFAVRKKDGAVFQWNLAKKR